MEFGNPRAGPLLRAQGAEWCARGSEWVVRGALWPSPMGGECEWRRPRPMGVVMRNALCAPQVRWLCVCACVRACVCVCVRVCVCVCV